MLKRTAGRTEFEKHKWHELSPRVFMCFIQRIAIVYIQIINKHIHAVNKPIQSINLFG